MTYEARDDKLRMVEVAIEARQRLAAIYEEVPFVYQPDMMLVAAEELERSASQIRDYVKTGHPYLCSARGLEASQRSAWWRA